MSQCTVHTQTREKNLLLDDPHLPVPYTSVHARTKLRLRNDLKTDQMIKAKPKHKLQNSKNQPSFGLVLHTAPGGGSTACVSVSSMMPFPASRAYQSTAEGLAAVGFSSSTRESARSHQGIPFGTWRPRRKKLHSWSGSVKTSHHPNCKSKTAVTSELSKRAPAG